MRYHVASRIVRNLKSRRAIESRVVRITDRMSVIRIDHDGFTYIYDSELEIQKYKLRVMWRNDCTSEKLGYISESIRMCEKSRNRLRW